MKRSKVKADCRADTRGGRWAGIPVCLIKSAAYRDLGLWARAALVELVARMNGSNNGKLHLSTTELCEAIGTTNRRKACAVMVELMEHGFIDVTAEGQWKQRQAREYRLTFVTMKRGNLIEAATNEYLSWKPKVKSGGDGVSPGKAQSGNGVSPPAERVGDGALPRFLAHRQKTARNVCRW